MTPCWLHLCVAPPKHLQDLHMLYKLGKFGIPSLELAKHALLLFDLLGLPLALEVLGVPVREKQRDRRQP